MEEVDRSSTHATPVNGARLEPTDRGARRL